MKTLLKDFALYLLSVIVFSAVGLAIVLPFMP
jgi:hypothetical protein